MDFIHDRKSNILFSLYGSKVSRIRIHNRTLTLTVDELYQLVDGEERAFSGEISFKDCDVDLCKVLIFNKTLGMASTVINTLFHRAIAVGKRVRTETRIAYSAVSVSYAAVELAKNVIGDLAKVNVLLLGAGQMGELTARHLADAGVNQVLVANRRYERAVELAAQFNGRAVEFDKFMTAALDTDIVITSTGAPHYVVKKWETSQLMKKRKGRVPVINIR